MDHPIRAALEALERSLAHMEMVLVAVSFVTMLGVSLLEIVARNVFHVALPWADMLLRYSVLWVALPGAALAVVAQRHISLDPMGVSRAPTWQKWAYGPMHLLSSLVCGLLAWAAARFWWWNWHSAPQGGALDAVLSVILPGAFALMAVHFLLRCLLGPKTVTQT